MAIIGNIQDINETLISGEQITKISSVGEQKEIFSRHADTNGNGTGTKNANIDYSSAQGIFKLKPAAGEIFRVSRLLVQVEDTFGMLADEYGNLGSALSTGIGLRVRNDDEVMIDLMDGVKVKTNAGWGSKCYDVELKSWGTSPSNESLLVRWTFSKSGQFIRLNGDNEERIEVLLDDNLAGLISHYFLFQGYKE